ncbi:MAG: hypothetical protein VX777_07985 [Chlamydiota bacterium]|nr:hypothetical protein [Chlamydiota bacterium]
MNKVKTFLFLTLFSSFIQIPHLEARGGRGGGFQGGGGAGGGRGAMHMNRSPSMSRSVPRNIERPRSVDRRDFERRDIPKPVRVDERRDFSRNIDIHKNVNIYNRKNWFGHDYWRDHPNRWYHNVDGVNWWRAAAWGTFIGWLPWRWSEPIYYNYPDEGNFDEAEELINNIPNVNLDTVQWLPLGVFALSQDNGASTNMYLQIAVSKEGIISGTYINTTTNTNQPIEGMIEQKSQRAAWKVIGTPDSPLMETGAHSLTEKQSTILVHFPDGSTQQWSMMRLEQP